MSLFKPSNLTPNFESVVYNQPLTLTFQVNSNGSKVTAYRVQILKDINDAKIKLYYFDLAGITSEEMFEILNGKEVSCDNRFLEHKTIYKLEAKK